MQLPVTFYHQHSSLRCFVHRWLVFLASVTSQWMSVCLLQHVIILIYLSLTVCLSVCLSVCLFVCDVLSPALIIEMFRSPMTGLPSISDLTMDACLPPPTRNHSHLSLSHCLSLCLSVCVSVCFCMCVNCKTKTFSRIASFRHVYWRCTVFQG